MKTKSILILIGFALSFVQSTELPTVDKLDVLAYLGDW